MVPNLKSFLHYYLLVLSEKGLKHLSIKIAKSFEVERRMPEDQRPWVRGALEATGLARNSAWPPSAFPVISVWSC